MAGSLSRTAASDAPQAAPAICEKPNKAAAAPALSPNGDSAAALDSGLAIADPFRRTALDLQLLSIRARQLGGDVPRRRGHRHRVLHPRTS